MLGHDAFGCSDTMRSESNDIPYSYRTPSAVNLMFISVGPPSESLERRNGL